MGGGQELGLAELQERGAALAPTFSAQSSAASDEVYSTRPSPGLLAAEKWSPGAEGYSVVLVSEPSRVDIARQTPRAMSPLMDSTEPSIRATFTTSPLCQLRDVTAA